MKLNIINHRSSLKRVQKAIQEGQLTIGFIGGSITDQRGLHNWPEPVTSWFVENFPEVRIIVENAAIGATGSQLGVFRAQRDLIEKDCDLVFIEFAVNDGELETERRMRSREGLIRKLLQGEGRDLVFAYTFSQDMYKDMINERVPASIAEFEQLADHYGIGSVWMGLYAMEEVRKGRMRWEEWLPDGLHPQNRGSLSYGQAVIDYLEKELLAGGNGKEIPKGENMPLPINPNNWENAYLLPFSRVKTEGPWKIRRSSDLVWIDQLLETSAVGAKLSFEFEGRGLLLGFDFGKLSADFRFRLDGGQWTTFAIDRPEWCGPSGWFRIISINENLPAGKHGIEIEVIHGDKPGYTGTRFSLAMIGVVR